MTTWFALGLALAASVSAVLVGAMRLWAERRQVLDIPNDRSSHTRPTPRGGGLALVVVVLLGAAAWSAWADAPSAPLLAWGLASAAIAAISWWDDLHGLSFGVRLAVHAAAAAVVLLVSPVRVVAVPWVGAFDLGWAGQAVAFLWIVGLTNAYNFMDGIDGIAGGQGVVAAAALAWAAVRVGALDVAAVTALCGAACVGFLVHNWPPARIFMGDVGSAFLGFTFSALACIAAGAHPMVLPIAVLALWPFVFDTAFTFLRRLRRGENVFEAHRSHLYQRLVICGWSHATVTSLYLVLAAVGAAIGLGAVPGTDTMPAGAAGLPSLAALLWITVVGQERRQERRLRSTPDA